MVPEARRSQRIDYHAPVELVAQADPVCHVLARSLDLSAGGMQLWTPIQMQVGSLVTCRVDFEGRPAALPGRVAWLQARDSARHGDGHGMGICFDALGEDESALVRGMLARATTAARPVQVEIDGLEHAIDAQGELHAGGIRLSAALPILSRGGELSFRLERDGPSFRGRIGIARLTEIDGERRLEVDLQVDAWEAAARTRRHAHFEPRPALVVADASASLATTADTVTQRARRPTTLSARTRRTRLRGLTLVAIAIAGSGWAAVRASEHARKEREFVVLPKPASNPSGPSVSAPPLSVPAAPLPRGTAEPASIAPAVWQHTPAENPTIGSTAQAPEPAESRPPETAPASPAPLEPVVIVGERDVLVRIPYEGTLEAMRVRVWSEPHALALDLPNGHTSLALGRHVVNRGGGITDVQLNTRSDETLLRVKLTEAVADFGVTLGDNSTLEIRIAFERRAQATSVAANAEATP